MNNKITEQKRSGKHQNFKTPLRMINKALIGIFIFGICSTIAIAQSTEPQTEDNWTNSEKILHQIDMDLTQSQIRSVFLDRGSMGSGNIYSKNNMVESPLSKRVNEDDPNRKRKRLYWIVGGATAIIAGSAILLTSGGGSGNQAGIPVPPGRP